ncbi:MAG TPA: GAF domain-containing protein [Blastocatellia bacterium]|nr:GAF domain-containing protein [Blastocatellia bacterium]
MRDQISNLSPIVLGLAVAGVIIILGVIAAVIFFMLRSRSRKRDDKRMQSEFAAIDREAQFASAVEQTGYQKDPDELIRSLSVIFRDHLSMPLLGIYAGRQGAPSIERVSAESRSPFDTMSDSVSDSNLPASLPSSAIPQGHGPQVTSLGAVAGSNQTVGYSHDLNPEQGIARSPAEQQAERVAIFPWRGPFGWNGIIITHAEQSADANALARFGDPVARLGDRLGVAMQLKSEKAERDRVMERSLRTAGFAQALLASMESPAPLSAITQEVASLVGGESAALWRVEQGGSMVRMVAAYGLRSAEFLPLPLGQGLAGTVAQSSSPLSIEDAPADPRCLFPREAKESGIGSYLAAPLVANGETLGVLEVHTTRPHQWSDEDSLTLQSAASLVAEVLKSTDARGNRLKVESAYLGLSEALQRLRSREEVMGAAVEVLGHALGVSRAIVVEFDERGAAAPVKYEYRMPDAKSALGASLDPEAARKAIESVATGEPVEITDARAQSLMGADIASSLDTLSEVALPLRLEGKTRALIFLHQCDREREWHPDEVEFADRVSRQLALSLSNVKAIDSASRGAQTAASRIGELEAQLSQLESALADANAARAEAQPPDQLRAAAAEARAAADTARRAEVQVREECERLREDQDRLRRSSQQLLEINRLKSEFIVNAGHELEASLQTVLGFAEQIQQGAYGPLTAEQHQAMRGLHGWAKRMQNDIEWLIEYGSTRSRRLEPKGDG